jgi:PQQ-dependent dehydrogenase (s-GDH family)
MRVVAQQLKSPWEIRIGPDGMLWITERVGLRVLRVDPQTGAQHVALTLSDAYQAAGQDGLLGLTWHPRLLHNEGLDYVYLAYTYETTGTPSVERRLALVRYRFDATNALLVEPERILEGLPASSDHNAGRLVWGPDDKLYYSIGDQGRNQFDNRCLQNQAQVLPAQAAVDAGDYSAYQGKVLRLNPDGTIPADNPVINGVRSHIFTYGHRNPQGLVFSSTGTLYSSEHGPKTDDELNRLQAGKNYGWPYVAGYQDDKAYVYAEWFASAGTPCAQLEFSDYVIPPGVPQHQESEWTLADFVPPLKTFYTVDSTYNFHNPACADAEYVCWPTIAPSSIDFVSGTGTLASWGPSLLVPSLKQGIVYRVALDGAGVPVAGDAHKLFSSTDRYRDIAVSADGHTFYVITDNNGPTSGPTQGVTFNLQHAGAVLEFKYP